MFRYRCVCLIGVAEHQLNRANVNPVGQQPARAFVTQVVPVQIDLPEIFPIDSTSLLGASSLVAVGT